MKNKLKLRPLGQKLEQNKFSKPNQSEKKPGTYSVKGKKNNPKSFKSKQKKYKKQIRVLSPQEQKLKDILKQLRKKHPLAFPKDDNPILKIGIREDIIDSLGISKTLARQFCDWYSAARDYKKNHKMGAKRLNLEGQVVDIVTKSQEIKKKTKEQQRIQNKKVN